MRRDERVNAEASGDDLSHKKAPARRFWHPAGACVSLLLGYYQVTRHTSCAVRAALCVVVIWNVPAPVPGVTWFGKFSA